MNLARTTAGLVIEVDSEEETERLGQALAEVCEPGCVIGLIGPLGAGKTRLVRAIAESLGVDPGAIASPTFVLIHEYEGRIPVYHFDVYRLESPRPSRTWAWPITGAPAESAWSSGPTACSVCFRKTPG